VAVALAGPCAIHCHLDPLR